MEPMGCWSIILLISLILSLMFPISLADNSLVKPDHDTSLAIQQIQECLPSCSAGEPSQDTYHTASSASVRQASPSVTNGEVNIGGNPPPITDTQNQSRTRDLPQLSTSTSTSNPFQSQFITPHGGPPRDHVIDIDDGQQSGQAITGMETSTQTQYPTRGSSEPSISLTTTRSYYLQSQFLTQNPSLTGHGHLPDQLNNIHETPSDQPFKLGKAFLGLTFQAALALMIFHFQGPSSSSSTSSQSPLSLSSSSSDPPSISFDILGASMAIGFTCTLIGILFRNAYPNAASFVEYVGIFSAAFGFFTMMEMFLPENFSWTVWPTGVLLLLVFAFVLTTFLSQSNTWKTLSFGPPLNTIQPITNTSGNLHH